MNSEPCSRMTEPVQTGQDFFVMKKRKFCSASSPFHVVLYIDPPMLLVLMPSNLQGKRSCIILLQIQIFYAWHCTI